VRQMKFMVYRHAFAVPDLRDGETYLLDIGSATATPLSRDNKVVLYATGSRGSSAYVLIGDASIK
jgi:hypothetical protein